MFIGHYPPSKATAGQAASALDNDESNAQRELRSRHRHFMNPDLLQSQFDDLQEPQMDEHALTVALGRTPEQIAGEIEAELHLGKSA